MSKKSAYLETDLTSILRDVNWDKVHSEIQNTAGYASLKLQEQEETRELVWTAVESFLARDVQEFENVELEKPLNEGNSVLDLVATLRGTMMPYEKYAGSKIIVDWKTTSTRTDSAVWRKRCYDSWQWKFYAALEPDAKLFEYRGLSRDTIFSGSESVDFFEPERVTGQILIELNDGLKQEVFVQKNGILAQYNSLINQNYQVWPRNFDSCNKFGRECTYYKDCTENTMPLGANTIALRYDISYSRMSRFMLCPERERRDELVKISGEGLGDSDATVMGQAFHAGICEVYKQVFKV